MFNVKNDQTGLAALTGLSELFSTSDAPDCQPTTWRQQSSEADEKLRIPMIMICVKNNFERQLDAI